MQIIADSTHGQFALLQQPNQQSSSGTILSCVCMAGCGACFGFLGQPCCFAVVATTAPSGFCFLRRQRRRQQRRHFIIVIIAAVRWPFVVATAIVVAGEQLAVATTTVVIVVDLHLIDSILHQ